MNEWLKTWRSEWISSVSHWSLLTHCRAWKTIWHSWINLLLGNYAWLLMFENSEVFRVTFKILYKLSLLKKWKLSLMQEILNHFLGFTYFLKGKVRRGKERGESPSFLSWSASQKTTMADSGQANVKNWNSIWISHLGYMGWNIWVLFNCFLSGLAGRCIGSGELELEPSLVWDISVTYGWWLNSVSHS